MKRYIRIDVSAPASWVPTTIHDSNTINSVLDLSYPKNFGESLSTITINFLKDTNTADDAILAPGKEIRIWHNTSIPVGNADADRIFKGYIINKNVDGQKVSITATDYFIKAQWSIVSDTSHNYETATNVTTILSDLCTHAGLTASTSGTPSPLQVNKFYSEDQNVFERIQYLLNLVGWYGYYDPTTTQTIKFQDKAAGTLRTFSVSNIISIPSWGNNSADLVNDIIIVGGSNNITLTQDYSPSGSAGYVLATGTVYPEALDVSGTSTTVNGGTPKISWASTEYSVLNNGIWFGTGMVPDAGVGTLHIQYSYQTSSVSGTAANPTSQTNFATRQKTIQKRDTLYPSDLSALATNLVADSFWGNSIQEVSFIYDDTILTTVNLGDKADVTDPFNGRSITYTGNATIIYGIEYQWPYPGIKVSISSKPLKNPMQQTSVQDSVEKVQLELGKINPTSLLRKDGSTAIGADQDFGQHQITNVLLQNAAVAPAYLGTGGIYFDTSGGAGAGVVKVNLGTAITPTWTAVGAGSVTGTGTAGTLSKWSTSTALTDSVLSESGGILISSANLNIDKATPYLMITSSGDTTHRLQFTADSSGTYITSVGHHMYLNTLASTASVIISVDSVTILTLSNTTITSALPLAMGTKDITGTGDVLPHASLAHASGSQTYPWSFVWSGQINIISPDSATTGTITHSNAEIMEFGVATGGKFKFVIG